MNIPQTGAAQRRSIRPGDAPQVRKGQGRWFRATTAAILAGGLAAGCINVQSPDKPIVIELNINIRQEVIYRLAADAANTIDENEDIF